MHKAHVNDIFLTFTTNERFTIGQFCPLVVTVGIPTTSHLCFKYYLVFYFINTNAFCILEQF